MEQANMEFNKLEKFIEERKQCEEKIKLFDELIKIDGEEWRAMVAELNKKEYEDRQKRLREMEREEQEDWDRHLEEIEKRQKMEKIVQLFKEIPFFNEN